MKVSLNWLKQLTTIELSNEALIERINAQIAAIEGVVDMATWYKGVVVGEIVEAKDHPAADKLGVYQVDIGDTRVQVCAGDKSLQPGDKIAYMPPGVAVPESVKAGEPFILEKRDLRGEESNGMLGSAKELVFGDDHEGVLTLETQAVPGSSFADAFDLNDLIIDVENKALTHRPDAFGLIGFARELAGVQQLSFARPPWFDESIAPLESSNELPLEVENTVPDLVPRFTAITLKNIVIKPSPQLMQSYLHRVGVRPINNVVDITNYMMLLSGQPLHAYDYDAVAAQSNGTPKLIVRYKQEGDSLELLDGKVIEPRDEALLVCTEQAPIGLGGAMGGASTEVHESTKNIILEAATWNLYSLRRTSMAHGVTSEAVTRFIRGQRPGQDLPVLLESVSMLEKYADATVAGSVIDNYPGKAAAEVITVTAERINMLLGAQMTAEEMKQHLENVECEVSVSGTELAVIVPWWRADLHIAEDIVEEVGRLVGYDKLGVRLPSRTIRAVNPTAMQDLKNTARTILKGAGANELLLYSFVSEDIFAKTQQETVSTAYRIRNALRPELAWMRTSVAPSVLDNINHNIRSGYDTFALYEIGTSHSKQELNDEQLPYERETLALTFAASKKKASEYSGAPFYQARNYLQHLLDELAVADWRIVSLELDESWWITNSSPLYAVGRVAKIVASGKTIGIIGDYAVHVRRGFKLPDFAAGFELDMQALQAVTAATSTYAPLSKFPSTDHDITMQVQGVVQHADMQRTIMSALQSDDMHIAVIGLDDFVKDGAAERNISFRVSLQHKSRTLTTKEVNELIDGAVQTLVTKYAAHRV